jgi:membrane protein required for colicin V production
MSNIDWIILGVVAFTIITAARHGFFREAFGIGGLIVGYLLAAWQYQNVAVWFEPYAKSEWLAEILGYFAIFIGVLVVAGLLGKLAQWAMKKVGLDWFDRLMGGALGFLKGSLSVAVLLVATTSFAPTSKWVTDSALAPYFLVVGRAAIWIAPSDLRARFYQGLDVLHRGQQSANAVAGNP